MPIIQKGGKGGLLYTNLTIPISFNLELNQTVQHQPLRKRKKIHLSQTANYQGTNVE